MKGACILMSVRKSINDNNKRIKKLKLSMILGYTLIIVLIIIFISTMTIRKTDTVLKSKVSFMTSALNVQMKMNINSYLSKMETTGTLIFASEEVYKYDATAENLDEYEMLNTEKSISDTLFNLCIIENFVDFGIVYSNNHIVGKVSNGTTELFGDNLYKDLSASINRQRTHDGWSTGYKDNFKRIYYVKRLNENAILVTSFYTTELENVFEHPGGIGDITIRLVEGNDVVIYSSQENETGKFLPDDINSRISDNLSGTIIDNEYLITANSCGDNWKVICSVPTEIILKEKNEVQIYIVIVGIITTLIAVSLTILLSLKISNPVNNMVTVLDKKAHFDLLTGILNKRSYEEYVENVMKNAGKSEKYALILIDVDNFKGVNDTLGHEYGDKVLANIGDILRSIFRKEDFKGRIGGDEFSVFLNLSSVSDDEYIGFTKKKCEQLCNAFHNNYTGDDGNYKISASIGVAFYNINGNTFSELYKYADKALYNSKHKGKDTYTIYTEELES